MRVALCIAINVILLSFFTISEVFAGGASILEQETLLGDRAAMSEAGVDIEFVYTGEFILNTVGGVDPVNESKFLDNIDLTVSIDTGRAGLWENGTLFFYGLSNHGVNPTEYVGDLQTTSNIEAFESTRVYEIWYEHAFADGAFALLVGLHDLNSEFYTSDYAGLFTNSSFGIGPNISANVPVSIFNVTAPAVRAKAEISSNVTVLAAVYDGDPGDPEENYDGLHITIDPDKEGLMHIAEIQFNFGAVEDSDPTTVFRAGAWYHSGDFEKFKTGETVSGDSGFYATMDHALYRGAERQGLGIFAQIGFAPADRNEVPLYIGAGINYTGLIPGRNNDTLGLGVAYAKISQDLIDVEKEADGIERTHETAIEVIYNAPILPWLTIQPDYQIIQNPGGDPDVDTAYVTSLRVVLNL